ncbi:MAG: hypothetical protein ACOYON_01165 [Fimbriimonas sp.]
MKGGITKIAQKVVLAMTILAVVVAVATFPVENGYAARSVMAQRILPSANASLFGDVGEKVGSPQRLIIDDQAAFIAGNGEEGVRLVNETYLRAKGIYPLQMQTVSFVAGNTRAVAALFAVIFGAIFVYQESRRRRS